MWDFASLDITAALAFPVPSGTPYNCVIRQTGHRAKCTSSRAFHGFPEGILNARFPS